MTEALVVTNETTVTDMALKPKQVVEQVKLIQSMMKDVMKPDTHYGTIPGCGNKPTLFKAGAEKLLFTFRLKALVEPEKDITIKDMGNGHREYLIITHIMGPTGVELATGLGSCSTHESKYRWRNSQKVCPKCNAETIIKGKEEYGGGWLCFAKKGGCGAKFEDNDTSITSQSTSRIENEDIADCYNTCLKMAKKRSVVDGTLSATAASDVLTQDLEDLSDTLKTYEKSEPKEIPKSEVTTTETVTKPTPKPVTPTAVKETPKPAATATKPPARRGRPPKVKAPAPQAAPAKAPTPKPTEVKTEEVTPEVMPPEGVELMDDARKARIVSYFATFEINQSDMEIVLKKSVDKWDVTDKDFLQAKYYEIKNETITADQFKQSTK